MFNLSNFYKSKEWVAYKDEWIDVLPAKINPTAEIISSDDHTIIIKINNIKQVK